LPARDWVAAQLGTAEGGALELLAGRPAVPQPDRGPIVCVCHGIGAAEIAAAVRTGANSVTSVGACTRAGTNCGSCRPAIARLVAIALGPIEEAVA